MTQAHSDTSLHDRLLIIDGLIFFSDGDPAPLRQGNVAAANVTTLMPLLDLEGAIDETARWLSLLARPDSPWIHVRKAVDIERAHKEGRVGFIMGWQNALPFGDCVDRVRLFYELGLRVVQLTYNQANLIGDGCLEDRNAGLSKLGRQIVEAMNQVGMAIDLSHTGEQTCLDTARMSSQPVLLTHANAYSVAARPRNKSDAVLRAVAESGGIVGVSVHGFMNWKGDPKSPPTLDGFVEHVRYVANLVGYEHIGMGNDFASVSDSSVTEAILEMSKSKFAGATGEYIAAFGNKLESRYPAETPSPREMGRITLALSRAGLSESQIEGILGRNFLRAFSQIWR